MLAKFGAPDDEIFGVEPLSLNILGDAVLVALMGNKLDVKTIDLAGGHEGDRWDLREHLQNIERHDLTLSRFWRFINQLGINIPIVEKLQSIVFIPMVS